MFETFLSYLSFLYVFAFYLGSFFLLFVKQTNFLVLLVFCFACCNCFTFYVY